MEWLIIVGLAAWVFRLSQRTSELERQMKQETRAEALNPPPQQRQYTWDTPPPSPAEAVLARPAQTDEAPSPVTHSEPPAHDIASRPELETAIAPAPELEPSPAPELEAAKTTQDLSFDFNPAAREPLKDTFNPIPSAPTAPRERNVERWLSENGLAWLGGGALALGGIFLVAYAAQQGLFTPMMRLWSAVTLGVALIGASEWLRRSTRDNAFSHPLVAALLAGAGAATLYGAVWGAHGLYQYIDWATAALALGAIVVLLLGLALLHGEAIGILAIVAGLLAPLLTTKGAWPESGLSLYIAAVTVTGYMLAGLRRWPWLAGASMLGAFVWHAISFSDGETLRALVLLGIAAIGGCALAFSPMTRSAQSTPSPSWDATVGLLPALGIVVSSVLLLALWYISANTQSDAIVAPATTAIGMVALAALSVRTRIASPFVLATAIGALVLGFLFSGHLVGESHFDAWAMGAAAAVAFAGFGASLDDQTSRRAIAHGAGAAGSLILLVFTALAQPDWSAPNAWLVLASGGVFSYLAAELCTRLTPHAGDDIATNIWTITGSALLLLALDGASPADYKPLTFALAALSLTLLHRWRGWQALSPISLIAGGVSLARALAPSFTGAAFAGEISIWFALGVLLAGAMSLLAASFVLRRGRSISESADSFSTGALVLTVMSAFLAIHHLMSGEQAAVPLSGFVRFSLYTLVLMVAGFSVLPSGEKPVGLLARTRGHLMLGAGLFGALYSILFWNPWWGLFNTPIQAAPLFNEMALAYAAPGLLALCTAGRFYQRKRGVARCYAIAGGLFGVVWLVLEIRHAFHGAEMRSAPIGLLEGTCYALAALALALFESWLARIRQKGVEIVGPLTDDLRKASAAISITALAIALWLVLACFNPIWGAVETTILDAPNAIGLIFVQAVAAALAYGLARVRGRASTSRNIAVLTALMFVLIAGLSVIRITHHTFPVDGRAALFGLEGLWYALWPMALTTCVAWMLALRFVSTMSGTIAHITRQYVGVGLWLALAWMMWGLCVLFSPWWGPYPIELASLTSALFALGAYLFAAWLVVMSARWPIAAEHALYVRLALLACVIDLFITLTLVVRYLFRGPEMTPALREASLETWTYSAVWALFSAIVLWVGTTRRNTVLRWAGLALLLTTTAKVFLLDMARLDGVIRAASFLGLGGVLVLVALAVRRNSQRQNSQTEA